jgi:hypothetical protein
MYCLAYWTMRFILHAIWEMISHVVTKNAASYAPTSQCRAIEPNLTEINASLFPPPDSLQNIHLKWIVTNRYNAVHIILVLRFPISVPCRRLDLVARHVSKWRTRFPEGFEINFSVTKAIISI